MGRVTIWIRRLGRESRKGLGLGWTAFSVFGMGPVLHIPGSGTTRAPSYSCASALRYCMKICVG